MSQRPTGPACGNNPNHPLTDGDRQAVADFKAYLAERAALRDRIAEALEQADYRPDMRRGDLADAIMPVLPPPANRGAVLREAADRYAKLTDQNEAYDREHGQLDEVARIQHGTVRDVVTGLRRMADEAQPTQAPAVDLPTLARALDGLHTLIATSSRDWGQYRVDAWIWAVLCGWDCEQTEHDDTCTHGALEEMQERHGWDDAAVAKARRYRSAVRALVEAQQDGAAS
jgi:hypothetical protein